MKERGESMKQDLTYGGYEAIRAPLALFLMP